MLSQLNTPVTFMVFNRPDVTRLVFNEIKKAKPKKLFIIADGPRKHIQGEEEKCKEVRSIVTDVDWECELVTNFADSNMGCRSRIASGIDWVFEHTEESIFLEDDCLPHQSFFQFTSELLQHYRNDERVMFISGNNFQFNRKPSPYSYYFSAYNHVWGWAAWKRTWKHYDISIKKLPEIKENHLLHSVLRNDKIVEYFEKQFDLVYQGKLDTWDYQLLFACWINNGLTILPSKNLVTNIGFGTGAAHTFNSKDESSNITLKEMNFPLVHPPYVMRDFDNDRYEEENHLVYSFEAKVKRKLRKLIFPFKVV